MRRIGVGLAGISVGAVLLTTLVAAPAQALVIDDPACAGEAPPAVCVSAIDLTRSGTAYSLTYTSSPFGGYWAREELGNATFPTVVQVPAGLLPISGTVLGVTDAFMLAGDRYAVSLAGQAEPLLAVVLGEDAALSTGVSDGVPTTVVEATSTTVDLSSLGLGSLSYMGAFLADDATAGSLLGASCTAVLSTADEGGRSSIVLETTTSDYLVSTSYGSIEVQYSGNPGEEVGFAVSAPLAYFTDPGCGWALDPEQDLAAQIAATFGGTALPGMTVTVTDGIVRIEVPAFAFPDLAPAGSMGAAASSQDFVIEPKRAQTMTAPPNPRPVGVETSLRATTSQGLEVTWSTSTPLVCTVAHDGGTWSVTGLRTGACKVTASNAGDDTYLSYRKKFTIAMKKRQTAPATPSVVKGEKRSLPARSAQGGLLTWSTQSPGVCTVSKASGKWSVVGKSAGKACRLTVTSPSTSTMYGLTKKYTVTVKKP